MRQTANQKGFTLIELLLYTAIAGSLLVAVSSFFALSSNARIKAESIVEVNQQGEAVLVHIARAVRNAAAVNSPGAGGSAGTLSLAMPDSGQNPTVFVVSSGTATIQEAAAAAIPLTNTKVQVGSLVFENVSRSGTPGAVRITLTLSRINNSGRNEYDFQKTFVTTTALRWP
jgi:prepilin-type N-terminal cleavage/methylation domain-containing protein